MSYKSIYLFIVFLELFSDIKVYGHGFGTNTLIKTAKSYMPLNHIVSIFRKKRTLQLRSYSFFSKKLVTARIKAATYGKTNCYIKIYLNNSQQDEIACTPSQEFFALPSCKHCTLKRWIPAYKLKVGDKLLTANNVLLPITGIEFIEEPLNIILIHVKGTHTYFVGRHSVLAHNMSLPVISLGLSVPFGTGAVAGGTAGSFFGPVTITGGIIIGGLIGVGIAYLKSPGKLPEPYLEFDKVPIREYFKEEHGFNIESNGATQSQATEENSQSDFTSSTKRPYAAAGNPDDDPWKKNYNGFDFSTTNNKIENLSRKILDWLGPTSRLIKNKAGDIILLSADGLKRVRFDINRPFPHENLHSHVEELINGEWQGIRIYPHDVPHK